MGSPTARQARWDVKRDVENARSAQNDQAVILGGAVTRWVTLARRRERRPATYFFPNRSQSHTEQRNDDRNRPELSMVERTRPRRTVPLPTPPSVPVAASGHLPRYGRSSTR